MDLELLNHINVDLKWNILKKGRRSMARRPRKTGADTFELGNKKQDPTAFETKKVFIIILYIVYFRCVLSSMWHEVLLFTLVFLTGS